MHNAPLTQKKRELWGDLFSKVQKALQHFRDVLEQMSDDDWRASLMWETLGEAEEKLALDMMSNMDLPKPPDFMHWRQKYAKEVL
jgi:hypothetical protein